MSQDGLERRESKRVFFAQEDRVDVILNPAREPNKEIEGTLLSISAGGLSIAAAKNQKKNIREGDEFWVSQLRLPGAYDAIASIEVEVKYIIYYKKSERITIGCEFLKVSGIVKEQIEEFIEKRVVVESEEDDTDDGITVF